MTPPHQHWKFGASTMQRIVESETPMLSPFEIFTDCTQAHLDANRGWLQPRFQDIDIVLCSHLHVDHVGWNTRLDNGRWVPTFPNARYLISRREWDHWQAAGMAALARTGDYITDSVLPVFAAGQADLVGDEHAVASEISVELAPGHTPGQMMVRLGSGRYQAILSADLMHHPLQVRYPDWSTRFCTDPVQ